MTVFLTPQQNIDLRGEEWKTYPVIDRGKLEGAVGAVRATWGGDLLHPTLFEQAAALIRGIIDAHAFMDGNKRTAWLACVTFLGVNGVDVALMPTDEVIAFVKAVEAGRLDIPSIAMWLVEKT